MRTDTLPYVLKIQFKFACATWIKLLPETVPQFC